MVDALPVKPRIVLFAAIALSTLLQARVVFTDDGINWPDEIYQSFEPAHRLVFGHGLVAWEFLEGARTWAVPGFVALWLFLCKVVGADSPSTYIRVVKLVFVALSGVSAFGTYRLALKLKANELSAAVAGAVWALCAMALYFSPRAMAENLAAPLVVWGLSFLVDEKGVRLDRIIGASLLGLATIVRLQVGIVCLAALISLIISRRGRTAVLEVGVTLLAWALVFGVFDALAWHALPSAKAGGLFHSAVVYWRYNIVENRGAGWGTAPWTYYFFYVFKTMPAVTIALGASLLLTFKRAWPVWLVTALFLALHLYVSHKELRFMVPVMPVVLASLGVALTVLPGKVPQIAMVVLGLALVLGVSTLSSLTMGDVGSYGERPASSAWDDFGNVNRLLRRAGEERALCGLLNQVVHPAWSGGYTYLHKNVPLYGVRISPPSNRAFNYVIAGAGSGGQEIAREGNIALIKISEGCEPDQSYTWKLP